MSGWHIWSPPSRTSDPALCLCPPYQVKSTDRCDCWWVVKEENQPSFYRKLWTTSCTYFQFPTSYQSWNEAWDSPFKRPSRHCRDYAWSISFIFNQGDWKRRHFCEWTTPKKWTTSFGTRVLWYGVGIIRDRWRVKRSEILLRENKFL